MTTRNETSPTAEPSARADESRIPDEQHTTSQRQVELCGACAHHVSSLQHDNAVFALRSEYDTKDGESVAPTSPIKSRRRPNSENIKMLGQHNKRNRASILARAEKFRTDDATVEDPGRKVVFPESEYDVLEKRLISLEGELQNANDNEQFKRLCKMGVLCEERWAKMYCRDYNKDFNEYRNEAISVLKQNLNIRRDGLRPFMRLMNARSQLDDMNPKPFKRDVLTVSPAVNIISHRTLPPKEYLRGNVKRSYGTCVPITTLTTGPIHNYSYLQSDPCYMIENELFDVESRMKRCSPSSKEYKELAEEGRRLRLEWRQAVEELRRSRSLSQPVSGYDLKKCVVINRGGKKVAVPVADEDLAAGMDGDIDVDVQD